MYLCLHISTDWKELSSSVGYTLVCCSSSPVFESSWKQRSSQRKRGSIVQSILVIMAFITTANFFIMSF